MNLEEKLRYLCIGIHDGWIYPFTKEDWEIYRLFKNYFGLTD